MAERVVFEGGPFTGFALEGHFHRKGVEVQNAATRYPSRIIVQYDTTAQSWLSETEPDIPFTADRNKVLVAEYEFDIGLGYFAFAGWSLKDRPAEPPAANHDSSKKPTMGEIHFSKVFDESVVQWGNKCGLVCPVCGFNCQHVGNPCRVAGNDSYEAGWDGKGPLVIVPFEGECGCRWDLCFGFEKGDTVAFVRIITTCAGEEVGGFVYFIEAFGIDAIKIGYSRDPDKRVDQLATGSPVPLRLLGKVSGNRERERELHLRFDKYRKNQEWFHAAQEIRAFAAQYRVE